VYAFDPTPKSIAWARANIREPSLVFHPIGLAPCDGVAEFAPPATASHVSFARLTEALRDREGIVRLRVQSLSSIMRRFSHHRLDLLKMDIEGWEYCVIDSMLTSPIRPEQMAVEFHHGMYGYSYTDTNRVVARLRQSGYAIFHISATGREYSFCLI
jgi:FkbM family methyltransferase